MRRKKVLILLVLKLLETNTDAEHPLTQTQLAAFINPVFPCDRKTVGRNISALREVGYPIKKTPQGFYLDRKYFTLDESALILRAVDDLMLPEEVLTPLRGKLQLLLTKNIKR